MERRVRIYRPRSRSRERRFQESPPARRSSHERSPYRQRNVSPRRRRSRERDRNSSSERRNESPEGRSSRERRDNGTQQRRRFTERPTDDDKTSQPRRFTERLPSDNETDQRRRFTESMPSESLSFKSIMLAGSYGNDSPLRDHSPLSKRRKFSESPERSPVDPYSNVDKSAGRRRFSPDAFDMTNIPSSKMKSDPVVDKSAGRNRFSPNTLLRLEHLQKEKESLYESELDKIKGYSSPDSDKDYDEGYGADYRRFMSESDSFYRKPSYQRQSNLDDDFEEERFGRTRFENTRPQDEYVDRNVSYDYARYLQSQDVNMTQRNINYSDQRLVGVEKCESDSVQINRDQQYWGTSRQPDTSVSRIEDSIYYRKNEDYNLPEHESRVENTNQNRNLDYFRDDGVETRKRVMERPDFLEDNVKYRRLDYPERDNERYFHPVDVQRERSLENVGSGNSFGRMPQSQTNRNSDTSYPSVKLMSDPDPFSRTNIAQLPGVSKLGADKKRILDSLLSQSEMLNQKINSILMEEKKDDKKTPESTISRTNPPYVGIEQNQPGRYIDETHGDSGYNPAWRQNQPVPRKANIPTQEQGYRPPVQPGMQKKSADVPLNEQDFLSSRQSRAQRQPNVQDQPNIIQQKPGFRPPAPSRIPGQTSAPGQSNTAIPEQNFLPKQSNVQVRKNTPRQSNFQDREIASSQQPASQRKPEHGFPSSRQAKAQFQSKYRWQRPEQTNVNMQKQEQLSSRPMYAAEQKPVASAKEPSRPLQTPVQKPVASGKGPSRYPQTPVQKPVASAKELSRPLQTSVQKPVASGKNFSKSISDPSLIRNTSDNLQQFAGSSENEGENFDFEDHEPEVMETMMESEVDRDTPTFFGLVRKHLHVPDQEFPALGRWTGISRIKWNITPTAAQTKVVVSKKDGPTLFTACGTQCTVESPYQKRIKFLGDSTLGNLNFDLEDCHFADEGLYLAAHSNRTIPGPNLKLWTHAIEGESALVLFKMPKMPPNEKVTVYKRNGDTIFIAWGTMAQFTDKYKGKADYFGDTEKGLIVFSIKNTVQAQSGVYMASVGNKSYEGRQLKIDLPAQKKKRKIKFASNTVKETGITSMIEQLKRMSKAQRVGTNYFTRSANYNSVPLFFDYKSILGPAGSIYITGTICAFEDLYLARVTGKSKEDVRPKVIARAVSNLLSKTYNQLVENSWKELELPISLLSNQISKGILELGGEIAKIPPVKKEIKKTNIVSQKNVGTPVVKPPVSSPVKPVQTTVKTIKPSSSGDIKIDLLHANDVKAKEILSSMATSATVSNGDFEDGVSSMVNRKGVELKFLLKTLGIREKFKTESGLSESYEKIRSAKLVYSNLKFFSFSERQQIDNKELDELIIFHGHPKAELARNAYEILTESTKLCVMHLQWYSKQLIPASRGVLPVTVCRCFVWIQGKLVGDAVTVGGKAGRQLATAQALAYLFKTQPVIQYVELENQGSFCVTVEEAQRRAEVMKNEAGQAEQSDDNPNKWLSRVCEDIVMQYSKEATVENLEFQPGFPKKVLLDIKNLCSKQKLTFKAYLKDKDYINVVCKNLNPGEILSLLQQNGGTSGKYRLVPKLECEAIAEEITASLTDDLYLKSNPFEK